MKNRFKIVAVAMAALMAAPHMTTIAQAASVHDVMASNGKTASFVSQKDAGSAGDMEQQPVADGVYTLSFTANEEGKDTASMLQGVFDPNVKLTVQNGEMKISMLNTGLVSFLLDFSVESGGVYPEATRVDVGTPDSTGQYPAQEFTFSISELDKEHKGAVLVTAMGGQISDIGNYDKYTKLDMTFSNMQKGWEGYTFQETAAPDGNEALTAALINEGYDTDGDKSISAEEIQAITGDINLADYGLTDISMLAGNLSDKVTSLNLSGNK